VPNQLTVTQRKLSPMDPARPSSIYTASLNNYDTPIAVEPKPTPAARSWLQALLPGFISARSRVASIQKSMLDELGQVATLPLHEEALARQIVQAEDAESLWELRHALADAICSVRGDAVARQKMTEISFMFAGLLRRRSAGSDDLPGENVVHLSTRAQQSFRS